MKNLLTKNQLYELIKIVKVEMDFCILEKDAEIWSDIYLKLNHHYRNYEEDTEDQEGLDSSDNLQSHET
tara:strand:- start:67 stop:273 length:207 start_codon:yes stop_codon:yes gene_type:complete